MIRPTKFNSELLNIVEATEILPKIPATSEVTLKTSLEGNRKRELESKKVKGS